MWKSSMLVLGMFCLGGSSARLPAVADAWVEVDTPNFRIVSNNGERSAREVAWQFEQIRGAIARGWPWAHIQLERPVLIIGAKDEATMKVFTPTYFTGSVHYSSVSLSAWDRHYITLRTDFTIDGGEGVNPYRQAYWSYCNMMLSSSFHYRLPVWFSRGMAAVLSNTNITDKEIQFGRVVPSYMNDLAGARFTLTELLAADRNSPVFRNEIESRRFDAQAWGLLHFMLFGDADAAAREQRINELARALMAGRSSQEAVQQIYGPIDGLDVAYRRYLGRGLTRYVTAKSETRTSPKDFAARALAPADAVAIRAGVLAAANLTSEARALLNEARTVAPARPVSYELEGLLFDREQKRDEARGAYEKAVELGSENFIAYTRLAIALSSQPGPDSLSRRRALLEKSIALNDGYAQSYQSLGVTLVQMNLPDQAVAAFKRAIDLEPGQVGNYVSLAGVLGRLGKKDDALAIARAAMDVASNDAERKSVQSLLESLQRIK